jgi:hypothetical protein
MSSQLKTRPLSPICPGAQKKRPSSAITIGVCSTCPSLDTIVGSPSPATPLMIKKPIACPDAPTRSFTSLISK